MKIDHKDQKNQASCFVRAIGKEILLKCQSDCEITDAKLICESVER